MDGASTARTVDFETMRQDRRFDARSFSWGSQQSVAAALGRCLRLSGRELPGPRIPSAACVQTPPTLSTWSPPPSVVKSTGWRPNSRPWPSLKAIVVGNQSRMTSKLRDDKNAGRYAEVTALLLTSPMTQSTRTPV